MIKNRLYIFFCTLFLVSNSFVFSFAWESNSMIDTLTIDSFINRNRSAQSHADSFPQYYSSFDKFNYVYEIERKNKSTGVVDYELFYSSSPLTINYDSKLGYYKIFALPNSFFSYFSLSLGKVSEDNNSFCNFNALEYEINLKGVKKANYEDMTLTEGETIPPGDQETPLGVLGDLSSLALSINLVIKYLIWAGVLLMCYLILPTLLKKLLNYFLGF